MLNTAAIAAKTFRFCLTVAFVSRVTLSFIGSHKRNVGDNYENSCLNQMPFTCMSLNQQCQLSMSIVISVFG